MFDPEALSLTDSYTKKKLEFILKVPGLNRGCLQEEMTLDQLVEKAKKAHYLEVGNVGKQIKLYETEDIGLGAVSSFSAKTFRKLTSMHMLSGQLPVYLRYVFGNLFFLLDERDIEFKHFLTRNTTVAYNEKTKQIYDIIIGEFVLPNRLYHLERYDGLTTTLEKALKNEMVNAFHVHAFSADLSDLPQ